MNSKLEARFDRHDMDDESFRKSQNIRDDIKVAADTIDIYAPESREKSLALTKLEECLFWSTASLARN